LPAIQIFIDTSFIVALINERDQYHARAVKLADRYDGQSLIVTDAVLLEVGNALSHGYKLEAIQVRELPTNNIPLAERSRSQQQAQPKSIILPSCRSFRLRSTS
jgi:predicted nucleic acid-binding protein